MRRVWGIAFGLLAILFIASMPVQATPITEPMAATGTDLTVDGVPTILNAVNDQTVFYIQFYWLLNNYPQYKYSNHLFDSTTGDYNTDTTTHLDSDSYRHFWWQYFWLLHELGINGVRLGAFDDSPSDLCAHAYYSHKDVWDSVWDPMVEMAKLYGVYIIFCFAGSNAGGVERLDIASSEYADYTTWYEDVMTEYSDEDAIAIWDLYNEAYSDQNKVAWWNANGGYAAYITWRHGVSVNAQAHAGAHLVDMDSVPTAYSQAAWTASFADHFDLCDWHGYWSAEDSYLVTDRSNWSDVVGRPFIMGECALNAPIVPPYWWYWPWLSSTAHATGASTVWMTLYALPDYPVSPILMNLIPSMPVPPTPGGGGSGGNFTIPIISELLGVEGGNYATLLIIGAGIWFGVLGGRKRR